MASHTFLMGSSGHLKHNSGGKDLSTRPSFGSYWMSPSKGSEYASFSSLGQLLKYSDTRVIIQLKWKFAEEENKSERPRYGTGRGRHPPIWCSPWNESGNNTWHSFCPMRRSNHISKKQTLIRQMQTSQVQLPSVCATALICLSTSRELRVILRDAAQFP